MYTNARIIAALALASGSLCSQAFAQSLVNGNFESGNLDGWTIVATPNGKTNIQTTEIFDIDRSGPLAPSLAGKFSVGQIVFNEGVQEGIDLIQPLQLAAGTTYEVSFNWAAFIESGISNGEGGVFSIVVNGTTYSTQAAGEITTLGGPRTGHIVGQFTTQQAGTYNVGVRMTRPYTAPTTLPVFQYVDNIAITTLVEGACCLLDGSCIQATLGVCASEQGVYRGDSTTCATIPPCPIGACCLPNGECVAIAPPGCIAAGGTYRGDGTDCASIPPCPQPPTGACCIDGMCTITWETGCLMVGGIYHGDGTTCGQITCHHFITTRYDGVSNATGAGAGAYFNMTVAEPQGIVIQSFDINSPAAAGTPMTVRIYIRPGTYAGHENNEAAWVLLGEAQTLAAGVGQPTPVPIGNLHIGQGETFAFRVGTQNGGIRFSNPGNSYANTHLQLQLGAVQTGLFTGTLSSPREWNGTIHYSLGAQIPTGACCLPQGQCAQLRELVCFSEGGIYHGDNVDCSTIPPCPQPGACCFGSLPCQIMSVGQCESARGQFMGNGSACETCPPPLPGSYLILGAETNTITLEGVRTAILSTALATDADIYFITANTPTLAELMNYDAVLTWSNNNYYDNVALGNVLADYVDAGRGVVVAVHALSSTNTVRFLSGRWESGGYSIIPSQSGLASGAATLGAIHLPAHPIWEGVSSFVSVPANSSRAASTNLPAHAVRIADWSDDRPLILVSSTMANRAELNFYPGAWHTSAGGARVMTNALRYAAGFFSDPPCYANCDQSTVPPVLNVDDFTCFINQYAQGQGLPHSQQLSHYANCDGSTIAPVLNVDDFTCFINQFALGCP
jgi:hypothetical protein